jgi:hypothetical protein
MSEGGDVEQIDEPTRSAQPTLPEGPVSRVLEYFPPGGNIVTARDCMYAGGASSKGGVVKMGDGAMYECSGDKNGTWKKQKKSE